MNKYDCMIYPINAIANTTHEYLPGIRPHRSFLYIFILAGIIALLCSLPFIYTDISVKTTGITRPVSERTDVKSVISGIIDSVLYREGDIIQKDAVILRIRDRTTKSKRTLNSFEIQQRQQFIHDLDILTSTTDISAARANLITLLYKEKAGRYLHQQSDQEASLKKANKELEINTSLANSKVISAKEFFDIKINQEKIESGYKAFIQDQLSSWQQDLAKYRLELSQLQQQIQGIETDASYFEIKAPVAGVIQAINTRYPGGLLQAGETLCSISPEEKLIGECYVQTKDIGLLKKGQEGRYQFEAFNYNFFGVLTGKIISIDNDFTAFDNKPVFKVRCSFDSTQLLLKNGFSAQLKKGLGFQASFVIARRSLWQLLFDKMDNWLNPNAPPKTIASIH